MNFETLSLPKTNSKFAPEIRPSIPKGICSSSSSPIPFFQVQNVCHVRFSGRGITHWTISDPTNYQPNHHAPLGVPWTSHQTKVVGEFPPNITILPHLCKYKKSQLPNRSSPVKLRSLLNEVVFFQQAEETSQVSWGGRAESRSSRNKSQKWRKFWDAPEYISTTSHIPKDYCTIKNTIISRECIFFLLTLLSSECTSLLCFSSVHIVGSWTPTPKLPSKRYSNSPKTFRKKPASSTLRQGTVAVPSALRKRTLCLLGPTSKS